MAGAVHTGWPGFPLGQTMPADDWFGPMGPTLVERVLEQAPDTWSGGHVDDSPEDVAVAYVRWLEQRVIEAYGSLDTADDDEEVETPSIIESGRDHPLHGG